LTGFAKTLSDLLLFTEPKKNEAFILKEGEAEKFHKIKSKTVEIGKKVAKSLKENLDFIKEIYNIPVNGDLVLREFHVTVKARNIPAFIVFIDGMTDRKVIDDNLLQSLMLLSNLDIKSSDSDIADYIKNQLLTHNQIKVCRDHQSVIKEVNYGGCGIYIDGLDTAFTADVKGWEHRGVERPSTEVVIRGPQEGFTEQLRVNTSLIRKILKDEDLIAENITIGKRSQTACALMYIKDITNDSLVEEVRKRLNNINTDYIIDSGELEQLLEDSSYLPSPQIIATERPDRVASLLTEGLVAVVMHGSPFVLVMPATAIGLLHSPEDSYLRFPFGNFLRLIRFIGILLSLILPGIYIAITNYHQEMLPTDLLFSFEAAREKVPFPSIVEILIMEFAFELIREAGIRIPGAVGQTLGIIGALILGQAAVAANIVSPILIIVVAVTGLGSFAVPNFSLAIAFRILRFFFIFLGAIAGFLGIAAGLFIYILLLVDAKSFGVPFLVPFGPRTSGGLADVLTRAPIWKQEERPDYMNTKDREKQPHISRAWDTESRDLRRNKSRDEEND